MELTLKNPKGSNQIDYSKSLDQAGQKSNYAFITFANPMSAALAIEEEVIKELKVTNRMDPIGTEGRYEFNIVNQQKRKHIVIFVNFSTQEGPIMLSIKCTLLVG